MLTILKKHQINILYYDSLLNDNVVTADCSNYSINAQDRNGKHWALYLSTKKYHLSIFNSGKVDSRLSGKDIHIIKQNKNKIIKVASLIIRVIIGRYDIILNAKKK